MCLMVIELLRLVLRLSLSLGGWSCVITTLVKFQIVFMALEFSSRLRASLGGDFNLEIQVP